MTTTNEISQSIREELSDRYFRVNEYRTDCVFIEEMDEAGEPTGDYLKVSYKVFQFLYHAGQLEPLGEEMKKLATKKQPTGLPQENL